MDAALWEGMDPAQRYATGRLKLFRPGEVAVVVFDLGECFTYRPSDDSAATAGAFPRLAYHLRPVTPRSQLCPGVVEMMQRLEQRGYNIGAIYRPGEEQVQIASRDEELMALFRFKALHQPELVSCPALP